MYADDTTMYIPIDNTSMSSQELTTTINNEMGNISDWFKVNKLALNEKKTKYMLFGMPQREIKSINLKIDEKQIEMVKQFNFLGLELDNNMNWSCHIN